MTFPQNDPDGTSPAGGNFPKVHFMTSSTHHGGHIEVNAKVSDQVAELHLGSGLTVWLTEDQIAELVAGLVVAVSALGEGEGWSLSTATIRASSAGV